VEEGDYSSFEKLKGKGIYFRERPRYISILSHEIKRLVHLIVVLICFKYILFMSKFDYLYYVLNWTVSRRNKF